MLTMSCPASHYSAVHGIDYDSQNLPRTPYVDGDPPFPVESSYFMIPTFIQALFTILQAYFRQCAHVSIVRCRAPRMMVMGYKTHHFQSSHPIFMTPTFIHALFTISRACFRQCTHVSIVGCQATRMRDESHKDWGSCGGAVCYPHIFIFSSMVCGHNDHHRPSSVGQLVCSLLSSLSLSGHHAYYHRYYCWAIVAHCLTFQVIVPALGRHRSFSYVELWPVDNGENGWTLDAKSEASLKRKSKFVFGYAKDNSDLFLISYNLSLF